MVLNELKWICKYVKRIDLFPQKVQLLIKQEEYHKTITGAILSISLICLVGILFYNNIVQAFSYSDPTSVTTQIQHRQPELYSLNPTNFTLAFALQHANYSSYADESIYVVNAVIGEKTTNNNKETWKSTPINLIPCEQFQVQQMELKEYFNPPTMESKLCLDWNSINQLSLEGNFDANIFRFIRLEFKYCTDKNKRKLGPTCRSLDEIKLALQSNFFGIQLSSNIVDIKNADHPHKPKAEDIFTTTSSKIAKEMNIYLQPLTTVTDFGLFTEKLTEVKTLKYGHHTEMLDINESDTFLSISIRLDTVEQINYRKYPKLQTIIGQLGGLWNVIFAIALLLQKPLSDISYQLSVINSLFNFEIPSTSQTISEVQLFSDRSRTTPQLSKFYRKSRLQLDSIIEHNKKLDESENNDQDKFRISRALSQSIKHYFKIASKKASLTWLEYFQFFCRCCCCCRLDIMKFKQIDFAKQKVNTQLDILYIINKLQEIDKLKMLMLSNEQLNIFDYLPKPTIPMDPQTSNNNYQYFSILNSGKNSCQRSLDAQKAFQTIQLSPSNKVNQKLIESMDNETLELLKARKQPQYQPSSINLEVSESICIPQSKQCSFPVKDRLQSL